MDSHFETDLCDMPGKMCWVCEGLQLAPDLSKEAGSGVHGERAWLNIPSPMAIAIIGSLFGRPGGVFKRISPLPRDVQRSQRSEGS